MQENLLNTAVEQLKLRLARIDEATQYADGEAAFNIAKESGAPQDLDELIFHEKDEFTIPNRTDLKQWIAAPLSKGGKPVTRCLTEVKASDGTTRAMQVFLGTFAKSVKNRNDGSKVRATVKLKDGSLLNFTGLVDQLSCWERLFGKTFNVTKVTPVPTRKRNRLTGILMDADSNVCEFTEV